MHDPALVENDCAIWLAYQASTRLICVVVQFTPEFTSYQHGA